MALELLDFVDVLAWPVVVVFIAILYRAIVKALLPGSRVKFTISGVEFQVSLADLERSIEESLRGRKLSNEQWAWLRRLRDEGRMPYEHAQYVQLRPMRNAGLIREHPEGTLTAASEIEITHVGRLLVDAHDKK